MSEIDKLKRQARKSYERYFSIFDSRDFSCGHSIAQAICVELSEAAREFDETMMQLKQADSHHFPATFKRLQAPQ